MLADALMQSRDYCAIYRKRALYKYQTHRTELKRQVGL